MVRVDTWRVRCWGDEFTVGVPTSAEALSKVLLGLDAHDSGGAGYSTLASLSIPKCGNPSVFQEFGMCTERVCLLSLCCFSFIVMMMSLHLGSGP